MINIDWNNIPTNPGVYLWKNRYNEIIYIGKAKNLRSRMKSYFNNNQTLKTRLLVNHISDFDYQITNNDIDALLLEQNLINKHQPKYNIKIKNAGKYPYIELKNSNGISLSISRNGKEKKNVKKFGPYPEGYSPRKIIKLLSIVFPIDGCKDPKGGKPCINFQMGRCMGQCVSIDIENHSKLVFEQITSFFKNDVNYVLDELNKKLKYYDENLLFEESKIIHENIELILKLKEETIHAFNDSKDRDIIGFYEKDGYISISVMHVRSGIVRFTETVLSKLFNPDIEDSIETFLKDFYSTNKIPDELIVPFEPKWDLGINMIVPKSGNKKELLDTVIKQAILKYESEIDKYIKELLEYEECIDFIAHNITGYKINTIEMIDISSTMGDNQVGAVVSFKGGKPDKSLYRKYNINSIDKMDDYQSMDEVARRHFNRKLVDNLPLPDLFIVDGKYQLNKIKSVLEELNINGVTLMALKKDDKHKTDSIVTEDLSEIPLVRTSNIYNFLTRIQDEVHRFVINFHRSKRTKTILESELDKYSFLTEEDKNNLYKEFKTIREINIANEKELSRVLTKSKVNKLIEQRNEK